MINDKLKLSKLQINKNQFTIARKTQIGLFFQNIFLSQFHHVKPMMIHHTISNF